MQIRYKRGRTEGRKGLLLRRKLSNLASGNPGVNPEAHLLAFAQICVSSRCTSATDSLFRFRLLLSVSKFGGLSFCSLPL